MENKMGDVRSRPDSVWMSYASGHVSGSGATMTGTLDAASNLGFAISYPTAGGTNAALPGVTFPAGAVLIQMPLGSGPTGVINDSLAQTDYWDVSCEGGSGSLGGANSTMDGYRTVKLGHSSANGAYAFAFQRMSGTNAPTFEPPRDLNNPGSMACGYKALFVGRKTSRRS